MTTTLSNTRYVQDALAALAQCNDDRDLTGWDEKWCSNERYINLPDHLVMRLESAHDRRLRRICGVEAG